MTGQAAWITEHTVTQDASTMNAGKRYENLSALNPAHLKALLGQDVVLTLADGSTRTGTVYTVDPVNFSVALLKPRRPLIRGAAVTSVNKDADPVCVIPGHAVQGVEVAGSQKLALEALRGGFSLRPLSGGGAHSPSPEGRNCRAGRGGLIPTHFQPSASAPKTERSMSLEFLRSYSNPRSAPASECLPIQPPAGGSLHGTDGLGVDGVDGGEVDASPYEHGRYEMMPPPLTGVGVDGGSASGRGAQKVGVELTQGVERRRRVKSALEAARVPVEEVSAASSPTPALMVMGCLRLPFPYTADACECANEIVLSRVRQLVDAVR